MSPRARRAGRVILVGAGPGDPDLITRRGARRLAVADVVVYDALACPDLLALAPPGAECINVGKRGHDPPTSAQHEINQLLIERARAGLTVVRLKGGDPFVFGRGGEEARACVDAGIPFEVVPGVSAALAAPTYAGIPITDREHAASFAVVTGHKDPTRVTAETRWRELATAADTLVILMGMRNLAELVKKLLEADKDPATPAAAVMNASLPSQRVVEAPLAELPERVREAGLEAPAVVVIGSAVGLRQTLTWWERSPLFGARVLVTRAREHAAEMLSALREVGAEPVLMPMIRLLPPRDWSPLDAALDQLSSYDALVFTSRSAVCFFAARARERGIEIAGVRARIVCVGRETAREAVEAGLALHWVPSATAGAEALLEELMQQLAPAGRRFLLPRSEIARPTLPEGLRAAGARVDEVVAYRNERPEVDAQALRSQLVAGAFDALTFTSPSAVWHLLELQDAPARAAISRATVAAIGATTADALRRAGIEPDVVPDRPGGRELVEALVDHLLALRGGKPS